MKQATAPPSSSTIAAGNSRVAGNTSLDRRLELAAPFERAMHRNLVRVIEVAADGQAHRDACHFHAERLEQPGEIDGRVLAVDVGVGRENDLADAVGQTR